MYRNGPPLPFAQDISHEVADAAAYRLFAFAVAHRIRAAGTTASRARGPSWRRCAPTMARSWRCGRASRAAARHDPAGAWAHLECVAQFRSAGCRRAARCALGAGGIGAGRLCRLRGRSARLWRQCARSQRLEHARARRGRCRCGAELGCPPAPAAAPPALLGYSNGARVALLIAQQHPQAVSALVLYGFPDDVDAAPDTTPAPAQPLRARTTAAAAGEDFITANAAPPSVRAAYVAQAVSADPVRTDWRAMEQFAFQPEQVTTLPVLLLRGVDDPIATQADNAPVRTSAQRRPQLGHAAARRSRGACRGHPCRLGGCGGELPAPAALSAPLATNSTTHPAAAPPASTAPAASASSASSRARPGRRC